MEQYFQFTGASYDQLVEQVKPQAEKRIQSRLVLEAVAKAENITATDEDYEEELKVREMLPKKSADQIREDIAVRKAAQFAVENAKEK